jgi:hypothetical protein
MLRTSFRHSFIPPKAVFVDGEIAAIWGMGGAILSDTGAPRLITAPAIEREGHPSCGWQGRNLRKCACSSRSCGRAETP